MRKHVFMFFKIIICELGHVQKVYYVKIWLFVEFYSLLFAFLSVVLPIIIKAHRMILQDFQSGM